MKLELRPLTIFALTVLLTTLCTPIANARAAALTGVITSAEEGQMEGVLVSAKALGGKVTVTVVSDSQGRYQFPADRLKPAKYQLKIRAAGYILEDPEVIEVGRTKYRAALQLLKWCQESGSWPAYQPGGEIELISLPRWAANAEAFELDAA